MFKVILCILSLAIGLTLIVILSGYVDYRKEMNACVEEGGIVVKSSTGLKCVPKGKIKYI